MIDTALIGLTDLDTACRVGDGLDRSVDASIGFYFSAVLCLAIGMQPQQLPSVFPSDICNAEENKASPSFASWLVNEQYTPNADAACDSSAALMGKERNGKGCRQTEIFVSCLDGVTGETDLTYGSMRHRLDAPDYGRDAHAVRSASPPAPGPGPVSVKGAGFSGQQADGMPLSVSIHTAVVHQIPTDLIDRPAQPDGVSRPEIIHIEAVDVFEKGMHVIHGENRLTVSFEPDGLGKMDINLSLDNGALHAQVQVSDDAARNMLESNIRQILDALTREGLSVAGFSVSLRDHGGEGRTAEETYTGGIEEGRERKHAVESAPSKGDGMVNIFA